MRAVGLKFSSSDNEPVQFEDFDLPDPIAAGRDLLVEIKAVSVNPVDYKQRRGAALGEGARKVLGYDAAGIVHSVGSDVTMFKPGDEVFYAGSIARPGTNSTLHLVDERIVGRKPRSL